MSLPDVEPTPIGEPVLPVVPTPVGEPVLPVVPTPVGEPTLPAAPDSTAPCPGAEPAATSPPAAFDAAFTSNFFTSGSASTSPTVSADNSPLITASVSLKNRSIVASV